MAASFCGGDRIQTAVTFNLCEYRCRCQQVPLQMTLLDFGLAEELTPAVRHHFISFLQSISSGESICDS